MFSGQPDDRKGAAICLGTEAAGCSPEMATAWTLGGGDLHVVIHRVGAVCEGAAWGHCAWVRCHQPTSLEAVVTLAEDHLAAGAEETERGDHPTCRWLPVPVPQRKLPVPAVTERTVQTCPPFLLWIDSLYRVSRDTRAEEEHTQLLMPQSCREIIF